MQVFDWIIVSLYLGMLLYVVLKSRLSAMTMKNFAIDKQLYVVKVIFTT